MLTRTLAVAMLASMFLSAGCAVDAAEESTDSESVGSTSQAVDESLPMKTPQTSGGHRDWMSGVGTSGCTGSETSSTGNSSSGSYIHVTCDSWFFAEWGPGWYSSDSGSCTNGVITSGSVDIMN